MGKANISFPAGMLEDIDARAAHGGTTRSGFVQEAVATYTAALDRNTDLLSRSERIEAAIAGMREIGSALPPGPDGATLIRRHRAARPGWLEDKPNADDE
ncbi:MAG: hypothetical protein CVT60_03510 [Actinobacteria bacterium HGW-Actinobacteria-10]|nr:MAG: hypothetical protein CVT60_03510 [Actinobacteria bacterium HGW-Actinobacteria-10]